MPSPNSLLRFSENAWQKQKSARARQRQAYVLFLLLGLPCLGLLVFIRRGIPLPHHDRQSSACNCENQQSNMSSSITESSAMLNKTSDQNSTRTRPKVLGVVGIHTGFASAKLRKALRQTWLESDQEGMLRLEQSTGLVFRFVIGKSANRSQMEELHNETRIYKDFIHLDYEEEQQTTAKKSLAFFKAAYLLYDADFYVKAEENIYLRTDRLATLLAKERASSQTYLGCMKKGPVVRDSRQKWFEPQGYMLGNEYFYHAYAPLYGLSTDVVKSLALARNDSFRFFSHEDVTIGAWMLAINVQHEDNKNLCETKCTSTAIAVVDLPPCTGSCIAAQKIRGFHKLPDCSKSPTLPANIDDLIEV